MKIRMLISMEFPFDDYFAIGDHKQRLDGILSYIRDSYPEATLALGEGSAPPAPSVSRRARSEH